MYRYTTPTHKFTLPSSININDVTKLNISYKQYGNSSPVVEKSLSDATISENAFVVALTETETALFKKKYGDVMIQLRLGIGTYRLVSNIITITLEDVLKDATLS